MIRNDGLTALLRRSLPLPVVYFGAAKQAPREITVRFRQIRGIEPDSVLSTSFRDVPSTREAPGDRGVSEVG